MLRRGAFGPVSILALVYVFLIVPVPSIQAGEQPEIYEEIFVSDEPINGSIEVTLPAGEVNPVSAYLESDTGRKFAAGFSQTQDRISLEPLYQSTPIRRIVLLLQKKAEDPDLSSAIVESGGKLISGSWRDLSLMLPGDLTDVTDSLSLAAVGVADTHRVEFTTTTTPLSDSGIIWVTFPSGFGIAAIDSAVYSDDDPGNDGDEPVIRSIIIADQTVRFQLNQGAQPADPASRISVKFWPVTNDTVAQDYMVVVMTTDSTGNIDNGPAVSEEFFLNPGPLDHITIMPDTALVVPADSIVDFDVIGNDQYENEIDGLVFSYDVTVDSCGDVVDGVFIANKVGSCYFTANADGITDSSGQITVVPGPLGSFSISGTPLSRTAGQPFPANVNVTAYDIRDNIKSDYVGLLWFESSDPAAVIFHDSGNPYTFDIGDQGSADFAGSDFELRTAGSQTITATNGTIAAVSAPIEVRPAQINSFNFSVGLVQNAGVSFDLQVLFAEDEFGNPASGDVLISISSGGGSSPDGIPPTLNDVDVVDGSGLASQNLTNAVPTVLRGSVAGSEVETDTIVVHPGFRGRFEMSGYPDTTIAGAAFPDSIMVDVFDIFGNLKTNYADLVYFTSSDPQAVLPYTESSRYQFVPADSGSHSFDGGDFSLVTAGEQIITITDDVISDISETITVKPGQINEFIIYAPPGVTAGIPFTVGVSGCRDLYGNLTNGTVNVADSVGGGASPDGTQPVYNSIRVVSGSGSANQTLVNAVTTVLKGTAGSVVAVTNSITVIPGLTGEFDLNISSPQVSGYAFTDLAEVVAYDRYGNLKSNYDASVDTVVIESSAGGTMQNNILNLAGDFVNGVADLVAKATGYDGRGGIMTFSATSESGVIGISDPVVMRAVFCDTLIINEGVVSWGDTATGIIIVSNDGEVAVEITDLDVFTESGWSLEPSIISPDLPDSIQAGLDQTYDISIPIHSGFALGIHPLSAGVEGLFGSFTVVDTLGGFPDTLEIQSASQIDYVAGSISRDTLSSGEYYTLSLRFGNNGDAGLGLIDSSYLYFTDGAHDFKARISSGIYLPPNTPSGTEIILDPSLVDPDFVADTTYQATFHYFGRENGHFLDGIIILSDSIAIQSGVDISYITGSLNVDSLVLGQNASFAVRIRNSGTASLALDHEITKVQFTDSVREFIAYSDTSSSVRVDVVTPGDTTLYFDPTVLSPEFTPGQYLPQVTIRGEQNGIVITTVFETEPDTLRILSRAAIRIDTTRVMSLNAPFVNTAQDCSVKVALSNQGQEPADSIYVHLSSDGASVFPESVLVEHVTGPGSMVLSYPLTAGIDPDSGEIFSSSLSGGVGNVSDLPPQILPPLDNAALLIIETPAELSLSPIEVTAPPEAMDDTVTVGQPIRISARVNNLGQADITGPRRLVLDPGSSGFTVADSANRDYILNQDVFWDITAPGDPSGSAILTVRFLERADDSNDGYDAVGPDSVSTREFVVDTRPYLLHHPVISDPSGATDGVISTDQMFVVTDTVNVFGTFTGLSASIMLPQGFTTQDSLVKHPSGNIASWNIRAPAGARQDSISVVSWLYDVNTGDSISAGPDYVGATVVQAAALNLGSQIIGPQAALDGIIEPAGYFEYEALVINGGQANSGTGRLSLHLGHPEMIPAEETERDFAPGIPIIWTITVPDREISNAIPVWVTLDSIPDDENTGAPAVVVDDSSSIFVTIRELLPRLELTPGQMHSGSVVKGQQQLDFMSFTLQNNDRGGSFSIGLTRMMFSVESNLAPNSAGPPVILSGAAILADTADVASSEITSNEIIFEFPDTMIFAAGQSVDFTLKLDIASNTQVIDFAISLDSRNIEGVAIDEGIPLDELNAVSRQGVPLLWNSDPTAVLERSFAGSVTSYPNPFNPRDGAAKIGYYLAADSDLEIKIFTLLGELVWSKDISATTSLGRAGLHTGQTALQWKAVNDTGSEIRSGVYICVIKNKTTGEEERFKIAVVK